MDGAMGDEFQEADILWPDTPLDEVFLPFPASEPYEQATSVSRCTPAFVESSPFFLAGARSPSAGAIPDTDDDEEWQEADVLWPDTVDADSRRGGGGSLWSFRGAFGRAGGRRVKHPAPRHEGWWAPDVSSPIDIPTNVAARRLGGAAMAMGRRL